MYSKFIGEEIIIGCFHCCLQINRSEVSVGSSRWVINPILHSLAHAFLEILVLYVHFLWFPSENFSSLFIHLPCKIPSQYVILKCFSGSFRHYSFIQSRDYFPWICPMAAIELLNTLNHTERWRAFRPMPFKIHCILFTCISFFKIIKTHEPHNNWIAWLLIDTYIETHWCKQCMQFIHVLKLFR